MNDTINLEKCYEADLSTNTLPLGRIVAIQDDGAEGLAIGTLQGNKTLPRQKDIDAINTQLAEIVQQELPLKSNVIDLGNKANLPTTDKTSFEKSIIELYNLLITKLSKSQIQSLIGFADINKNLSLIDSTMLTPELLQMIAGTAGVNVTPAMLSVVTGMLADLSVVPNKTSFLHETFTNLIDDSKCTYGVAVKNTDGTTYANSSYKTTDFIKVTAGDTYSCNKNYNIVFYDTNKNFITGWAGGSYTSPYVIPAGASYLRTVFEIAVVGQLNLGLTLINVTYADGRVISVTDDKVTKAIHDISTSSINDSVNSINKNALPLVSIEPYLYTGYTNLYNPNDNEAQDTSIRSTNGTVKVNTGFIASGYIPIVGGLQYCCNSNHDYAWFDKDKVFISGGGDNWTNPITAPTNAKYIRITLRTTDTNIIFSYGAVLPPYEAYGLSRKIIFNDDKWPKALQKAIYASKWSGKKWEHLGDSLSSVDYSLPMWYNILKSQKGFTGTSYGIRGTTLAHKLHNEAEGSYNEADDRHLWDYGGGKLDVTTIGYNRLDSATWSTGNCMVERYIKMADDADLITVMGGTNDDGIPLGTPTDTVTSTIYGACNVLFEGLINKYPNKTIAFITPPQRANNYLSNLVTDINAVIDSKLPTDSLSLQLRVEVYKRVAKKYGIPVLDLFNTSGFNGVGTRATYLYLDGTHPTNAGQELLAKLIGDFIETL